MFIYPDRAGGSEMTPKITTAQNRQPRVENLDCA